jgi:hypothetical protein
MRKREKEGKFERINPINKYYPEKAKSLPSQTGIICDY